MSDQSAESGAGDARNPLDRLLDVGVYAPLGFALEFRRLVPELAEAGRRQVAFSRSLGKAALRTMSASAKAQAARSTTSEASASHDQSPTPAEAATTVAEAVADYASMTARHIIDLVDDLSPAQVDWLREAERAGKARKTVLAAVERALRGQS